MKLSDRMAGIDANLDDLQAGMEASSRAADALQLDTSQLNGRLSAPLLRSVLRHVRDLRSCARDQRAAMQELRNAIDRLQEELKFLHSAVRPPPLSQPQRSARTRSR
jgi:hypothetical protein